MQLMMMRTCPRDFVRLNNGLLYLMCRIGTEHEKLGFRIADNSRMDYDDIAKVCSMGG
jgi:hypothetical protein